MGTRFVGSKIQQMSCARIFECMNLALILWHLSYQVRKGDEAELNRGGEVRYIDDGEGGTGTNVGGRSVDEPWEVGISNYSKVLKPGTKTCRW